MSENFKKVKSYFDNKNWSLKRVHKAVGKWITEEEFEEITGDPYVE